MQRHIITAFTPNRVVSRTAMQIITISWLVLGVLTWMWWPSKLIPKPLEVLVAFGTLWNKHGLLREVWASFNTNLEALAWTMVISLGLAYLTVLPAVRPVVGWISKLRFLGLVGLTYVFTLYLQGGHQFKVWLLVFGMTVFFVTSMADEVASIPKEKFDHARTLRMGEWRVVWEVVVLGKMDAAIDVLRQNAAIGWMMLSMVEGLVRSEGGIGTLLLSQNKQLRLSEVFAIQLTILGVGVLQDYGIGILKKVLCPHSSINLERR